MSTIIEKTYKLIDALDDSELITKLKYYKNNLLMNVEALRLIREINDCSTSEKKIELKQALYQITDYQNYMRLYNELSIIVLQINKKYAKYTHTKNCHSKFNI